MRTARLLLLVSFVCGCTAIGFSPSEICSRDGMLFVGKHYDSGDIDDSHTGARTDTSSQGIACGRPKTPSEHCETVAATASRRTKNRLCAANGGVGGCAGRRFTQTTADRISMAARESYADAMDRCESGD